MTVFCSQNSWRSSWLSLSRAKTPGRPSATLCWRNSLSSQQRREKTGKQGEEDRKTLKKKTKKQSKRRKGGNEKATKGRGEGNEKGEPAMKQKESKGLCPPLGKVLGLKKAKAQSPCILQLEHKGIRNVTRVRKNLICT